MWYVLKIETCSPTPHTHPHASARGRAPSIKGVFRWLDAALRAREHRFGKVERVIRQPAAARPGATALSAAVEGVLRKSVRAEGQGCLHPGCVTWNLNMDSMDL